MRNTGSKWQESTTPNYISSTRWLTYPGTKQAKQGADGDRRNKFQLKRVNEPVGLSPATNRPPILSKSTSDMLNRARRKTHSLKLVSANNARKSSITKKATKS